MKKIQFLLSSLLIIAALFIGYIYGINSVDGSLPVTNCISGEDFKNATESQK